MPTSLVSSLPVASPVPELDCRPKGLGLPALVERYLAVKGPTLGQKTVANHRATIAKLQRLALPDHPSPGELTAWYARLRDAGYGEATIATDRFNLSAWWGWGSACALTWGNPASVAPWRVPPPTPRAIRGIANVWPRILACAQDAREALLLSMCRWCGTRTGEALAVTAEDYAGGFLSINKQRAPFQWSARLPKHGKCRRLPVHRELAPFLERLLHRPSVVGSGRGQCNGQITVPFLIPFRPDDLRSLRLRLGETHPAFAEENEFLHVLRHSRACELRENGNDVLYISKFLGHSNPRTTMRYLASMLGDTIEAPAETGATLLGGQPQVIGPRVDLPVEAPARPRKARGPNRPKGGATP